MIFEKYYGNNSVDPLMFWNESLRICAQVLVCNHVYMCMDVIVYACVLISLCVWYIILCCHCSHISSWFFEVLFFTSQNLNLSLYLFEVLYTFTKLFDLLTNFLQLFSLVSCPITPFLLHCYPSPNQFFNFSFFSFTYLTLTS